MSGFILTHQCWTILSADCITNVTAARSISSFPGRNERHVRHWCVTMEEPHWKKEREKAGKTVRFRVAAANSGRVLAEVFKDESAWRASLPDSAASEQSGHAGAEQGSPHAAGEANSHLNGLAAAQGENGGEADDLLLYASAKREKLFSNKRINICSKNGTIRGVRNKVSAGQVLFNNLSNVYPVSAAAFIPLNVYIYQETTWRLTFLS